MDREKYVDESWKETVELEKDLHSQKIKSPTGREQAVKQQDASSAGSQTEDPESNPSNNQVDENFVNYVSSLGYQVMIFLGEIPHPATNLIEKNLEQARFIIETLIMLKRKTRGNLSRQEAQLLEGSIYELQMKYVELAKQEPLG